MYISVMEQSSQTCVPRGAISGPGPGSSVNSVVFMKNTGNHMTVFGDEFYIYGQNWVAISCC